MTHDTNVSTNNNTKNVAVPTPTVEVKSSDGNVSRPSQVDGSPEQQIVCATTNSSSLAVVKGGAAQPGEQQRHRIILCAFVGLLILAVSGVFGVIVRDCLINPNTAFLDRSATTSTRMFLSLSGVKVLVAVIESVPIVGKFAEALSDMIDFSWWGCFVSMIVLKVVSFFFEFIKFLGRWPSILLSLSGCLLAWFRLKGYKLPLLRKVLSVLFSVTLCVYILIPMMTFGVAQIADTLEAHRGSKIETASEALQQAFTWDNIPDYFTRGGAEIRKGIPDWMGGIDAEKYETIKQEFDARQKHFVERTKTGIGQLSNAFVLYLAEKALACFLFPFVLLWGGWKLAALLCKQLDIPFNYEFSQMLIPPKATTNANFRRKTGELKARLSPQNKILPKEEKNARPQHA